MERALRNLAILDQLSDEIVNLLEHALNRGILEARPLVDRYCDLPYDDLPGHRALRADVRKLCAVEPCSRCKEPTFLLPEEDLCDRCAGN